MYICIGVILVEFLLISKKVKIIYFYLWLSNEVFFFYLNSLYIFDMRKFFVFIMMYMDYVVVGEC